MISSTNLHFQTLDYIIFAATLLVSIAIGLFYAIRGGRQRTTVEFHLGDRNMKVLPVAISLLVSFQSAVLLLGFPAEMYNFGSQYWLFTLSVISANVISAVLFAPLFHPLGLTSSYEYLEMRFQSRFVRLVASSLGIISVTWYSGIVLYGPAITLQVVTGFPIVNSIVLVGLSGIVYTAIGGIKAVIWTDAIQFLLMVSGMLAVLIQACLNVGGISKAWDICEQGGRINFFNFDMDPTVRLTFWGLIIGGTMKKIGYNLSQAAIQRMSTVSTVSKARCMILLAIPGFLLFGTLACLQGLMAYAYFDEIHCDPLEGHLIKSQNQLIPYFVMILFSNKAGLPGLFLSSIFSASLSSYSSNLNCVSAQVWEDFFKPVFPNTSEMKATLISKAIVCVFGVISIGLSFLIMNIHGPLTQITSSLLSSFGSTLTGLFLLGALFTTSNKKGAIGGGLAGFILILWMSMGSNFSGLVTKTPWLPSPGTAGCPGNSTSFHNISTGAHMYSENHNDNNVPTTTASPERPTGIGAFYGISFMWFDGIGILTTVLIGLIISYFTRRSSDQVDRLLIIPTLRRLCPCIARVKNREETDVKQSVPNSTDPLVTHTEETVTPPQDDYELSVPDGTAAAHNYLTITNS